MKERYTDPKDREVLTGVIYNGESSDALIVCEKGPDKMEDKPIERTTSEPEIIFIHKGTARISIDRGAERPVSAGKMVFLPPGSHARLIFEAGSIVVTLRIGADRQERLFSGFTGLSGNKNIIHQTSLDINEWMRVYVDSLLPMVNDGRLGETYHKAKIDEFICILFGYYTRSELAAFFHPVLGEDTLFRYFILRNIKEVTSVEQLALRANMSRSGFFHKFTRIYGESPTLFLRKFKAGQIRSDLINTDITLQSLAVLHGFNTYEGFSKFTKKMLGQPPKEVRRKGKTASKTAF